MIDAVTVEIPVAGINELSVQFGGGMRRVISATAPTDTTATWVDPETGVQSIYSGGGWVTQLTATIVDSVPIFSSQPGVNADNVVRVLAGQEIAVASIGLTNGTGTAPKPGHLTLNANGDVVVGSGPGPEGESNAEDLPHLINSRESINFATLVLPAAMTGATTLARLIAEIPLASAEITNGKLLHLAGVIRSNWETGTKPDGGVFLFICKEGTSPVDDGFFFNLAEGSVGESRDFKLTLGFTVGSGVWALAYIGGEAKAICIKNNAGTVTIVPAWTFATDIGEAAGVGGPDDEPVKLQIYLVTINVSATVTTTLEVGGTLSAILQ